MTFSLILVFKNHSVQQIFDIYIDIYISNKDFDLNPYNYQVHFWLNQCFFSLYYVYKLYMYL